MPHNVPVHQYVYVLNSFVFRDVEESDLALTKALWFGISVTPGRTLGCHLLLDNGAMVLDLPIHALRHESGGCHHDQQVTERTYALEEVAQWDCYGYDAEVWEPSAIAGQTCIILDEMHQYIQDAGVLWFAVDHLRDGYAEEPAQHKHLWVVAGTQGRLYWIPQDRILVNDRSFTRTELDGDLLIPPIKRQETVYAAE